MKKAEKWKCVPENDVYLVSNLGRVKSTRYGKEKILKMYPDSGGYKTLKLSINGKPKVYKAHILVARLFLGHVQKGYDGLVVFHKDGNRMNNNSNNLELKKKSRGQKVNK